MNTRALGVSLALITGLSLALAGCTSATGGTASSSEVAELTSDRQACVDAVSPDVEAASADAELVAPSAPLDLEALAGETVWYITVSMNQFSSDVLAGVQAAADAAGVTIVEYDGQGLANRFNEGISLAVSQDAAGIILLGIDPAAVSAPLADAAAAGIPVLNMLNGLPGDAVPDGMYGNFTSDFAADAETAVKWSLVDSGCAADIALLYSTSVPVWQAQADAATAAIEEYCPEDCSINTIDLDLANVATDIGSKLQTALQQNPDINYVFPVWDSGVPFVAPVLSAAGSDAQVISRDGIEASIEMIAAGDGQAMTIAMPPSAWIGWAAFDDIAREITGADAEGYVIPTRIIDGSNVGDGALEDTFPNYVDFETAFVEAWRG